jgi:hypothetical protein
LKSRPKWGNCKAMIPLLLHHIRSEFGASLASMALQFHGGALSLLLAVWSWPLVELLFRQLPQRVPDVEWIQLWCCPRCSTYNRRSFIQCTHCEYSLKVGRADRWVHDFYEWSLKHGLRGLRLYKTLGWILLYGITGLAVIVLKLYRFHQPPELELLATATLLLGLVGLLYFRMALRPQAKSLVGRFFDLLAGIAITALAGVSFLAWMEAQTPAPWTARVTASSNRHIELRVPGLSVKPIEAVPVGRSLQFDIRYAIGRWPLMGLRRVWITHFSGNPLRTEGVLRGIELAGSPVSRSVYYLPEMTIYQQTFLAEPGRSYRLQDTGAHALTFSAENPVPAPRPTPPRLSSAAKQR